MAPGIKHDAYGPATEKQKAWLVAHGVAFEPDINKLSASVLITAASPKRGNKPPRRRTLLAPIMKPPSGGKTPIRGYLTRQELAENQEAIQAKVREEVVGWFLKDAPKWYRGLERLRDSEDPDFRAIAYALDRILGKMTEKVESKNLSVEIKEIVVRLPEG